MHDQAQWDRLRAALDGWEAPRGLSLAYVIDERAGRFAFRLTAECGGSVVADFDGKPDDLDLERFARQVPSRLDYAAFDLLSYHICCGGRSPRLLAYGERAFRRWVDRYRYVLVARKARRTSPWTKI